MTAKRSRPAADRAAKITGGRSAADSSAPRELSAWLRAAAARRVRQVQAQGLNPLDPDDALTIAPLGRTGGDDDHRCDRCGVDCRDGARMWTGMVAAAPALRLVLGLCPTCARREGIR